MPVISLSPKPAICDQSTATSSFDELPFWQPHIPFTPEHQWSVNRRNHVESAYGRIKDEATQSLRRGTFRVMCRAKVTFMILLVAMAANIVEVDRWRAKLDAAIQNPTPAPPVPHTPRRLTLKREAEKARIGAAIAARATGKGKLTLVSSGAPPGP